jgi:DNA-binding transcriptional LysR family regulator
MDVVKLDLNLLVALDALLTHQNVTRAAQHLGLGQPAVSAALRRLRDHFGDELLTRTGNTYTLTPLADRLRPMVHVVLEDVANVFDAPAEFDPATSKRRFRVLTHDYTLELLGNTLLRRFQQRLPQARLQLELVSAESTSHPEITLLDCDLAVVPHGFFGDLPPARLSHKDLFRDRWLLIASTDNADLGDNVTMDILATQPWVVPFSGADPAGGPLLGRLRMLGLEPRISVVTHSCLLVPEFVAGVGCVAAVPERLLRRLAPEGIRVLPMPFDADPLVQAMWWHPRHGQDAEHRFLRAVVAAAAKELRAAAPVLNRAD